MLKYALVAAMALASVACSKWTDDERLTFDNQKDLKRAIPFIELTSADQLTAEQQKYYSELRAWKQTPHVRGFGWFGGWTAKGTDPQKYLRMLPDSVDIVSLWGTHGELTEDQKTDLKLFQDVKGGKVLLCWIVSNVGDQLTPKGKTATDYWITEKGGGDFLEVSRLMLMLSVIPSRSTTSTASILTTNPIMVVLVIWLLLFSLMKMMVRPITMTGRSIQLLPM